jgi:hypothetical protein
MEEYDMYGVHYLWCDLFLPPRAPLNLRAYTIIYNDG